MKKSFFFIFFFFAWYFLETKHNLIEISRISSHIIMYDPALLQPTCENKRFYFYL